MKRTTIAIATACLLLCNAASAQVTDQQIKDFFATNPTPEQIAAKAAALGMNESQISAAMGVAGYGGASAADRQATIDSWMGKQSGYSWGADGRITTQAVGGGGAPGAQQGVDSHAGVNQVQTDKGIWSPVENRWISNAEIKAFGATNPTDEQILQQAVRLGLNPYSINWGAYVISGASNVQDPKFGNLYGRLDREMWSGQYGYGYADGPTQSTQKLVKGNGNTQYLMPDGGYVSVGVHNGKPDQTYDQVLAGWMANNMNHTMDTSAQNGCYPNAAAAPPGAKICDFSQKTATPSQGFGGLVAGAITDQAGQALAGQTTALAGLKAAGPCQNGQTMTVTRAGIPKCVGTPISSIPGAAGGLGSSTVGKAISGALGSNDPTQLGNTSAQGYIPTVGGIGGTTGFLTPIADKIICQPGDRIHPDLTPNKDGLVPQYGPAAPGTLSCKVPPNCIADQMTGLVTCNPIDKIICQPGDRIHPDLTPNKDGLVPQYGPAAPGTLSCEVPPNCIADQMTGLVTCNPIDMVVCQPGPMRGQEGCSMPPNCTLDSTTSTVLCNPIDLLDEPRICNPGDRPAGEWAVTATVGSKPRSAGKCVVPSNCQVVDGIVTHCNPIDRLVPICKPWQSLLSDPSGNPVCVDKPDEPTIVIGDGNVGLRHRPTGLGLGAGGPNPPAFLGEYGVPMIMPR